MSHLHTLEAGITPTTLLLFHWELGLDMVTPNFGRGCWGTAGIMWPLAGQICSSSNPISWKMGRTDFAGQLAACVS